MDHDGDTPGRLARLRGLAERTRSDVEAFADRARQNKGVLGISMQTIDRDADIGGGILAGALAYRLFIFALPLSLFLISAVGVLGHVLGFDVERAATNVGLAGGVASQVAATGKPSATAWVAVSSFVVLVYVTRVFYRSLVVVHALAWHDPVGPAKRNLGGFGWFGGVVVGQLALVGLLGAVRAWSPVGGVMALGGFLVLDAALWLVVSVHIPRAVVVPWTELVPGAVLYAVGVLAVQAFNTYLMARILASKSSTYGSLGAAAAVLLGFFLLGRVVVGAAVLDATLASRRGEIDAPGDQTS
jgi:uncharacterized BrkB/YihY/UPF0761 family membrane protein